jgi:serine/threonine-protein kinase HipA
LALKVAGSKDHPIGALKGRHLALLGAEFGLPPAAVHMAVEGLGKRIEAAKDAIQDAIQDAPLQQAPLGVAALKDNLIQQIGKRWNGTFALIGKALLKKL